MRKKEKMTEHDFDQLFEQYPNIIEQMPNLFTSHEFILALAQKNQTLYIEALYAYRYSEHRGTPAPFRTVHGILAKELSSFSELVEIVRKDVTSKDIFRRSSISALWKKAN